MEPTPPPNVVSAESQQALELNVFASAKNSELQLRELRRIRDQLATIKWAAIFGALMLLLLIIR